jgi:hypothetical protein
VNAGEIHDALTAGSLPQSIPGDEIRVRSR